MPISDTYPVLLFENATAWEEWLAQHHQTTPGVWLRFYKKAAQKDSLSYPPALDVALCYGWIDSQTQKADELSYLQKFTPRRNKSLWSKVNRDKVARLVAEGRMKSAGLAEVERAKQDGRWDEAYDAPSQATLPKDFQRQLSQVPEAEAFYNTLNKTNKYAIIWRLQTAKKPETKAKRAQAILAMLKAGQKFH